MFRVHVLLPLLIALPLLGAGCSNDTTYATYTVDIETSAVQHEQRQASLAEPETTIAHLLDQVGMSHEVHINGTHGKITKLNGVISTLSKEWHLYINNVLTPITQQLDHVPVRASDTIELKYETTNNEQ